MAPSVCCWDRFKAGRRRAVQVGAVAMFAVLIMSVNAAPVAGTPLRQSTTDAADLETPTDSGATLEVDRMAAVVAVVNRHGVQGAENLQKVSAIAVANLAPEPELVVDARAERVAADAAAAAAAVAATEVALSVQATVEAEMAEAASTDAALAAVQAAEAEATAVAAAAARASAAEAAELSAKREAQVRAAEAAATRNADAVSASVVASDSKLSGRMFSLLIALVSVLGGILGLRFWRVKNEPFVLKANPKLLTVGS